MTRLSSVGQKVDIRIQPGIIAATGYVRTPQRPTTTARLHFTMNEQPVQQAWRSEKKRIKEGRKCGGAGHNKILRPGQHQVMIIAVQEKMYVQVSIRLEVSGAIGVDDLRRWPSNAGGNLAGQTGRCGGM